MSSHQRRSSVREPLWRQRPILLAAASTIIFLAWAAYTRSRVQRSASSRDGHWGSASGPKQIRHIPGSLVFISIGDFGTGAEVQRSVAGQLAAAVEAHNATFILGLGDNIYENGIENVDDPQLNSKHKNVYVHEAVRGIPWFMSLGDHDSCGNLTAQVELTGLLPWWNMPAQYYSFQRHIPAGGTVQFVVTDSVAMEAAWAQGATRRFSDIYDDAKSGAQAGNEEVKWLRATLRGTDAAWTIVSGHHPVYSGAMRENPPALRRFQTAMRSLLAEHRVDLYIDGHDHTAQHLIGEGGVNYVVNGLGGYGRHTVEGLPGLTRMMSADYNGFAVHQVTESAMVVTWIDSEGGIRDQITVYPQKGNK